MARLEAARLRLLTRAGNDFSWRFPLITEAVGKLSVSSCVIDGEAIVCDETGLADFELVRRQRTAVDAVLCAFDLVELDGEDLRRAPIEERKRLLGRLVAGAPAGVVMNEVFTAEGANVYKHACALGCEGIVSKRLGSPYRSGRSAHWIKVKNPKAPAVRREAEEEWM
jgi:bifunctional non-homologous end joining protein LigD